MTAPAAPVTRGEVIPNVDAAPGRAKPRGRTWDRLVEGWLRGHTLLIYLFLYFPILVVVVFSFNATNRRVTHWEGFSLKWYESVLNDTVIQAALANSFRVAISTAILATLFGTMAALGLQRTPRWFRTIFEALTFVSIIVPEIVIALSTLVFYSTSFDVVHEVFGIRWRLGFETIIAAHALFNISLVMLLVRARLSGMDRTHVEASFDLYGTPWRTFWQITFPQLLPAIVAGFLLSFTFSFDDYVITYFVSGAGTTTLPLYVFSTIRKGVTPATNAVAAVMLLITLTILVVGQFLVWRNARRSGQRGAQASVAGMIAEQSG
ncbi:MAG TPA: ABC transporter permease [Candidatus Limnocylindrales bacterium]|nr:ABC transporter permease [Candidatus Limnocylindrales bacterium]